MTQTSTSSRPADPPLAAAMVRAFLDGGRTRAVMPAGRADEVRDALTRMMVDALALDEYRRDVTSLLEAAGVPLPLNGLPLPSYADADIAAHGFAGLPSDELALLALDPDSLDSVSGLIRWDIPEGEAAGLTLGEWHRQATRQYLGTPAAEATPAPRAAGKKWSRGRRYVGYGVALAAGVLLAVGVGLMGGFGQKRDDRLAARVDVREVSTRGGAGTEIVLSNTGPRPVFVTLIPVRPPAAGPLGLWDRDAAGDYLSIPAGKSISPALPQDLAARAGLVVFTDTPAGDVLRKVVPADAAGDRERLKAQVEAKLAEYGYRDAVVSTFDLK